MVNSVFSRRFVVLLCALVFCATPGCGGSGGGDDGGGGDAASLSAQLTREAVVDITTGDEDFASIVSNLQMACDLDASNEAAGIFKAIAKFLQFLKATSESPGTFHSLYTRAGFVDTGGPGFYDFCLEAPANAEGDFRDAIPRANELMTYLRTEFFVELDALCDVLATVSTGFEYTIDATIGGRFFDGLDPQDQFVYRLDYGDLMVMRMLAHLTKAMIQNVLGYDWANVDLNHFDEQDNPSLDALDVLEVTYPTLGAIADAARIADVETQLRSAWTAYLAASAHIRNETSAQEANGILTLGRDTFSSPTDRADTLADEAQFRTWGQGVVNDFGSDVFHVFDMGPTGGAVPVADQVTINFFRYFDGVNLRAAMLKTVVNPNTGKRVLGVSSWSQFDASMLSLGGILGTFGGNAMAPGDLQRNGYAVRLDTPTVSTKTMDGLLADWAANFDVVGDTPALDVRLGSTIDRSIVPNVGQIRTSIDATSFYLHIDTNLPALILGPGDRFDINVQTPIGPGFVSYTFLGGFTVGGTFFAGFAPLGGLELQFSHGPGGAGDFLELSVSVTTAAFESVRENIFIKVR